MIPGLDRRVWCRRLSKPEAAGSLQLQHATPALKVAFDSKGLAVSASTHGELVLMRAELDADPPEPAIVRPEHGHGAASARRRVLDRDAALAERIDRDAEPDDVESRGYSARSSSAG